MLAKRIKELRKSYAMTQAELAGDASVSRSYIAQIETGIASNPSPEVVLQLALALGVGVDELHRAT